MERIFEWEPEKSETNRKKHGIDFERAREVFFDPLRSRDIEGHEHGEVRWRTIGEVRGRILVVSHTLEEADEAEIIRIVSARKATRSERHAYEGQT